MKHYVVRNLQLIWISRLENSFKKLIVTWLNLNDKLTYSKNWYNVLKRSFLFHYVTHKKNKNYVTHKNRLKMFSPNVSKP